MHTYFLCFRNSIMKLLYLCNFGFPRFEICSCGIPICISKATIEINIGFINIGLCQISHNDLIMDLLSREICIRFHVSLFQCSHLKFLHKKLNSMQFQTHFIEFKFDSWNERYDEFPSITCLRLNSEAYKNPNLFKPYIKKYSEPRYEILVKCSPRFWIYMVVISTSEAS